MEKSIPIIYHDDPLDPDDKVFNYHVTLEPDSNEDYFTGKEIGIQMQAIAFALTKNLPQTATIINVNGVDMHVLSLPTFIKILNCADDHMASILFKKDQNENTDDELQETEPASMNNSQPVQVQNAMPNNTPAQIQKEPRMTTLQLINVQVKKGGAFAPFNLGNGDEPEPENKINSIGRSKLQYPIYWKDAKPLIEKHHDVIFNNPIGLAPANAHVTANRIKSFSKDCGLEDNALSTYESSLLDVVQAVNGNTYNVWIFTKDDEEPANNEVAAQTVNAEKENDAMPLDNESKADDTIYDQITSLVNKAKLDYTAKKYEIESLTAATKKEEEPDLAGLPDIIIQKAKLTDDKQRAAYLFDLISQIGSGQVDASLSSLAKDPTLFLKAVNALSWQKKQNI